MSHIKCPKCNLKNNFKYKNNLHKNPTMKLILHKLDELKTELLKDNNEPFFDVFKHVINNLESDLVFELQSTYEICMCINCGTDQCTPLDFCNFQIEFLNRIASNNNSRKYFLQNSSSNYIQVKKTSIELKELIEKVRQTIFTNTTKSSDIYDNSLSQLFWDDFWQWQTKDLRTISKSELLGVTKNIEILLEKGYKVSHNHIFKLKHQTAQIESHKNLYDLEINYIIFFSVKKLEKYLSVEDFESQLSKLIVPPNPQILETLSMSNNSLIKYKAFKHTDNLNDIADIFIEEESRKILNDSKLISSVLTITENMKETSISSEKHSIFLYKMAKVTALISFMAFAATIMTIPVLNDYFKERFFMKNRLIIINSKNVIPSLKKPPLLEYSDIN